MNSLYGKEELDIDLGGHMFKLFCEKVMFWPDKHSLIIADAHFGKISHFRKSGTSLPIAAIEKQFFKFNDLLASFNPTSVIFLGDLFHSDYNAEWDFLANMLQDYPSIEFILIQGNHDTLNKKLYQSAGLKVANTLKVENILFSHDDTTHTQDQFLICGHLHPGFILKGKGKQRLRLPCLWKSANKAVLPAYGEFTGLFLVEPNKHDTIYIISNSRIIPISF